MARNQRAGIKDNDGRQPAVAAIVSDGPDVFFNDTVDTQAIARKLARRGYSMNLSLDAGQYLCEEMLYTLQYERMAGRINGPVLFCHVPPLATPTGRGVARVKPTQIEQFVLHLLEDWHDLETARNADGVAPDDVQNVVLACRTTAIARDAQSLARHLHPNASVQSQLAGAALEGSVGGDVATHSISKFAALGLPAQLPPNAIVHRQRLASMATVLIELPTGEQESYTLVLQDGQWLLTHVLLKATDGSKAR
jgi:hypothetical protein